MDETGPIIVSTYPEPESVGVATDVRPWVRLDEHLLVNSVEGSVFISPEPPGGYDIKASAKRIKIRFNEELPADRTIVITFGSGIRDVNGNQMDESFVLAFSTGTVIDRARIRGRIKGVENPAATWIWAYPIEADYDPDPRADKAPYAVQPDIENSFNLSFLPSGRYRLFAVEETNRNRLWDPDRERIAVPSTDMLAAELSPPTISLMMSGFDLRPPSLRGAQALHRQGIRLSFDEPVDVSYAQIAIETESGRTLTVTDIYQDQADSSAAFLTTGIQRAEDVYRLLITGVKDQAGNAADSLMAEVTASEAADSIGPRFSWNAPAHAQQNVTLETDVRVGFSEAVILTDLPRSVSVINPDSIVISGSWRYPGSSWGIFTPAEPLRSAAKYTVQIDPDSLRDIFGNRSTDSLVALSFTTLDVEQLGSITGRVPDAEANLRVATELLNGEGATWETSVSESGDYRFDRLLSSFYRLWIYQDLDGNGQYTLGQIEPFSYSEPFTVTDDTIRVRPRWATENVTIFWKTETDTTTEGLEPTD